MLESQIIDIFDDVNLGETLEKVASGLPDDVKKSQLPTLEDRNELDDHQFALSVITKNASKINKFPINNRINTALSNEYFDLNYIKLPWEAQKTAATYIKQACDRFGLQAKGSVKQASEKHPVMTNIFIETGKEMPNVNLKKEAEAKQDSPYYYALSKAGGDESTNFKYAMPTPEYVEKAANYFEKFARDFSPEDRHSFALNVSKRAEELGVSLESNSIAKYAGTSYNSNVSGYLSARRALLSEKPQFQEALDKLASYQDITNPITFAKVLHEFDKKAGLDKHYDRHVADPYASTFGEKTASPVYSIDQISLTTGDIEKLAQDKYPLLKEYFGPTLADGLKKEGFAAFEALPDNAKEIIARMHSGEIQ